MERKLKVSEIFECIHLLSGVSGTNSEGKPFSVTGFCNEKGISEGVRRIANKTNKKLGDNYPAEQFRNIQSLQALDLGLSGEEEAVKIAVQEAKNLKINELLNEEVTLDFEELPDWNIMNDRLEANKADLSHNYTSLFERLFLNY